MKLLFIDWVSPRAYNYSTLESEGLGGSEASLIRVAELLKRDGHQVTVLIKPKDEEYPSASEVDVCITQRDAGVYVKMRALYPKAEQWLWLHDYIGGEYTTHMKMHLGVLDPHSIKLICVSDAHVAHTREAMGNIGIYGFVGKRIYNVVDSEGVTPGAYDKNKLLFPASAHKGLDQVFRSFIELRKAEPEFRLHVLSPGYCKWEGGLPEGVIDHGPLPHRQVIEHMRESLCVFYPQDQFAETFGLIAAEANAVGTPVLCAPMGALQEVMHHPAQFIDCRDVSKVVRRVLEWKGGLRPVVARHRECTSSEVLKEWRRLLICSKGAL